MSYHIQLPRFEGPLDLLLYLIRKEEMNIMEIEIHKITAQYLEFIQLMKELDLEVAGELHRRLPRAPHGQRHVERGGGSGDARCTGFGRGRSAQPDGDPDGARNHRPQALTRAP